MRLIRDGVFCWAVEEEQAFSLGFSLSPMATAFLGGLTVQRFFLSIVVIECGDPLHSHKTMVLPPSMKVLV